VRIRTVLTLSIGAAAGAAGMYLSDPEHGQQRRREARRHAADRAREGGVRLAVDAKRRAEELAFAAVAGYQEARADGSDRSRSHEPDVAAPTDLGHRAGAARTTAGSR
jgi:hypothetical protein